MFRTDCLDPLNKGETANMLFVWYFQTAISCFDSKIVSWVTR